MNFAKHAACHADGVTHFLTYADNNAVGYFAKQGFTKEITMDRSLWHGYIKDYDGGTLMECVIDPRLPHTELAPALAVQRACLDDAVRAQSNSHVVYPGLAAFAPGAPPVGRKKKGEPDRLPRSGDARGSRRGLNWRRWGAGAQSRSDRPRCLRRSRSAG